MLSSLPTSLRRAQVVPVPPYLVPSEAPPLAQRAAGAGSQGQGGLEPQALGRNEGSGMHWVLSPHQADGGVGPLLVRGPVAPLETGQCTPYKDRCHPWAAGIHSPTGWGLAHPSL